LSAGKLNKIYLEGILEDIFGSENVVLEHRFHPERRWRFDYAVPSIKLAVEYHGHSGFTGGKVSGHSTIEGLTNDCEKTNQARALGWTVLAFTAWHFTARDREKHKLQDPKTMILETFKRLQTEKKNT
jgi:hypothetical protein